MASGTGGNQHRGTGTPSGGSLLQRIINLETILGQQSGGKATGSQGQLYFQGVESFNFNTLSTASASFVAITGAPSVSVVIGSSGNAIIHYSCGMVANVANQSSALTLAVDGVQITALAFLFMRNVAAGGVITTMGATYSYAALASQPYTSAVLPRLTPGPHVFTMWYSSSTGTAQFNTNYLRVTPV